MQSSLTLGSRGSPLALAQARIVQRQLRQRMGANREEGDRLFPITAIRTTGDRIQDRRLIEAGGKGLFTKEVEEALLEGRIDAAVHSMKDAPVQNPPGLSWAAVLPRADPRDAFISSQAASLEDLPHGARICTASLRRQAQALALRPDLRIVNLRGNVETRLLKIRRGEVDAAFLACAGLERLGLAGEVTMLMDPLTMLPAVAQGAIGVQIREGDEATYQAVSALNDVTSQAVIATERSFLAVLDGSCRTPVAALAEFQGKHVKFTGEVLSPDGTQRWRRMRELDLKGRSPQSSSLLSDLEALGRELAQSLLDDLGGALLFWEV